MCFKIGHILELVDENGASEVEGRGGSLVSGDLFGQAPGTVYIVILCVRTVMRRISYEQNCRKRRNSRNSKNSRNSMLFRQMKGCPVTH